MKYKITPVVMQDRDDEEKFNVGYEISQQSANSDTWEYLTYIDDLEKARKFVAASKALPPEEFFE